MNAGPAAGRLAGPATLWHRPSLWRHRPARPRPARPPGGASARGPAGSGPRWCAAALRRRGARPCVGGCSRRPRRFGCRALGSSGCWPVRAAARAGAPRAGLPGVGGRRLGPRVRGWRRAAAPAADGGDRGPGRGPGSGRQRGQVGLGQREPGRVIVGRGDVAAPRVEHPLRHRGRPLTVNISWTCQLLSPRFRESHCTSSAATPSSARRSVTISPRRGPGPESPGCRMVAPWASCARYARSARTGPSNRRTALDRHACGVGDLLRGLSGTDTVLDPWVARDSPLRSRTARAGRTAPGHDPQPVVDRQREAPAAPRHREDGVTAVLAHRDDAQFLHRRPFCTGQRAGQRVPCEGVARTSPGDESVGREDSWPVPGRHVPQITAHYLPSAGQVSRTWIVAAGQMGQMG